MSLAGANDMSEDEFFYNFCCSDIVFPIFPCVVHFKVKSLNIPQLTDDCHENGLKHKCIN